MTDDADLGDPLVPQPGDPQDMVLRVSTRELMAIVAGLGELPTKVGGDVREKIRAQVRDAVLEARRQQRAARREQDAERLARAQERRERRNARHARANGTAPDAPPQK